MENSNFGKYLTIILTEMCSRVGVKLRDVDWDNHNWYWLYGWTEKEQDDFRDWLADYMLDNRGARKELSTIVTKNRKHCEQFADEFIWQYGWKVKNEK